MINTKNEASIPKQGTISYNAASLVEDYAIVLYTAEGKIVDCNIGAELIKGYKNDEIKGKHFSMFFMYNEQDAGLPYTLLKQASEKGKSNHEGWCIRRDGTAFWGKTLLTAIFNEDNELQGFTEITQDYTEKKSVLDGLKNHSAAVEQNNVELERFIYMASHHIQTSIKNIQVQNTEWRKNINSNADNEQKSFHAIKNLSASALDMVDELMAYTQFFKIPDNIKLPVDIASETYSVLDELSELIDAHRAVITVAAPAAAYGKQTQIRQLLFHLIRNAVMHSGVPRPVIHVMATTTHGYVSGLDLPASEWNKVFCMITITDNGRGFENCDAEKIFDAFKKLGKNSSAGCMGMGLSLVKKVVQHHDGHIQTLSTKENGTIFRILLPNNASSANQDDARPYIKPVATN